jgi:predicted transcriptional regulator
MTEDTREISIRLRLLRLVEDYPGLHLRELAREAHASEALAGYHLDALETTRRIESRLEGGYRRFYPREHPAPAKRDRAVIHLLRQRVPLEIVLFLLETGAATHKEVTDRLGLAKSTVSYQLGKLQSAGIVATAPDGQSLTVRQPKRVEALLLEWRPPKPLTDRFADLWSAFYNRRS